jgi:DNA-directed RNA polymerase alpha subunit
MAAYNALHRNGIRYYSQLAAIHDDELLQMSYFGPKRLADLKAHLSAKGVAQGVIGPSLLHRQLAELNRRARLWLA